MPFDESLAVRICTALVYKKNIEEKKMFGGIGFLLNANKCASEETPHMASKKGRPARERATSSPKGEEQ